MDEKIMAKLQEPFYPEEIEWRVGATNKEKTKGLALAYVTNRAIQNRLDDVFGCFGWKNEFREWHGTSQLCGLSILHEDQWITKWDGADDSATEATKGGLSDSMKRASYQWGIGRYLYKLPQTWVDIRPAGRSYTIVNKPQLPDWAVPIGYKYDSKPVKMVKPSKDVITPEQYRELGALCMTPDGKLDQMMADHLTEAYKSCGFESAKEITQDRFEKIKKAVEEKLLPFEIGG